MLKKLLLLLLIILTGSTVFSQTVHERIYLGTGEYSPSSTWDAFLRFDSTENYNSEPGAIQYTPEGTVPFKLCTIAGSTQLNFGHGFYLQESEDRMFVATIFTNQDNYQTSNSDTAVGAIAIFDNVSTLNGGVVPTRYIFGANTQLKQPHGCWLDETRDLLYVANTFGENILVFNNASTINGDVAPDRIISNDSLGCPVYIFLDSIVDRMFVCAMPAMGGPPTSLKSQVAIYNDASTLNGSVEPPIRLTGDNTRLTLGNQTVHNTWFNPAKQLLAVGHHTNELLFFNLNTIEWNPSSPTKYDLTPRIIRVDDPTLGFDSSDVNLYGFYWDLPTDRMFCSVGVDNPGGGPTNSCPPEAVKIFSNVSDSTLSGIVLPDRVIYWSNCSTYYPPQPIWLQKYTTTETGINENELEVSVHLNQSSKLLTISTINYNHPSNVKIFNQIGELVYENTFTNKIEINSNTWNQGMYFYLLSDSSNNNSSGKIIIK